MSKDKQPYDYARICWYCGREAMIPADRGYKCTRCGSTWIPVPEPRPYPVEARHDPYQGHTSGSPSAGLVEEIARARDQAADPAPGGPEGVKTA